MTKRYRNGTEQIAEHIITMPWIDMMSIGEYFSGIEIGGTETPDEWCRHFYDWAAQINTEYEQETVE